MLKCEIDACAGVDGTARKLWSAPRVIVSSMRNAEAKGGPSLPTPDSHFGSIDYGRAAS